jgi:hypothetical protein
MTLRQKQSRIPGVFHQPSAGFHQPLLQRFNVIDQFEGQTGCGQCVSSNACDGVSEKDAARRCG